jgi:hypothetical protein
MAGVAIVARPWMTAMDPKRRRQRFEALYRRAHAAGMAAAERALPYRIVVDADRGNPVESDAIGFAWVRVSPGNRGFGRWLLDNRLGHTGHPHGVEVRPPRLAMTALAPQAAYCAAFAAVLEEEGISAHAEERLD